jgi:hypothetical protein
MRMKLVFLAVVIMSFGLAQTQQGWEITGTVTNDSRPVKDAVVTISGASYIPSVRTDGQGRYSVKGLAPGRYAIGVMKQDNAGPAKSRTLTLAGGARLAVDFRMARGGAIFGRVLDGNKQPLRDMVVRALSKTTSGEKLWLREQGSDLTNDLGEYRISYLPDGVYVVGVVQKNPIQVRARTSGSGAAPGRGYPPITFYPSTRVPDAAAVLEMRSGDERPGIDIVFRKEATRCASFKVGGGWGTRTGVTLEERLGGYWPALAQGAADANGSYEVCGVPAGEYRLQLSKITSDEKRRLQVLGYQMTKFTLDKENVDLGTLEPLAQADIRGTVVVKDAASGSAVPAGIRVYNNAWEMQAMFTTTRSESIEPNGAFVLSKALLGEYGVIVEGLPAGYYVIGATQQGRSVLDRGLWPGDGDPKITLGADGASVTGRVLAADGAAIPDASVLLVPRGSGKHLVAQSDQTGVYQFAVGVQPGDYRLVAAPDLPGWQQQDSATVARLATSGMELKLGSRESRTVDLKIPATR